MGQVVNTKPEKRGKKEGQAMGKGCRSRKGEAVMVEGQGKCPRPRGRSRSESCSRVRRKPMDVAARQPCGELELTSQPLQHSEAGQATSSVWSRCVQRQSNASAEQ
ncbi:hypothetical protein ACQY0O_004670 [Thecaphora frezii]